MVRSKRNIIIIACLAIVICIGIFFFFHVSNTTKLFFTTPLGEIIIQNPLPETPDSLILYRVIPGQNDMIFFSRNNSESVHNNATSENDAPEVVRKSLIPYGGLPDDAKLALDKTEYLEEHRSSIIPLFPPEVVAKFPISTHVQYYRVISGHRVAGDGGYINLDLGNDGELLDLTKIWRTVTPSGTVPIISAKQALEKMQGGEILGDRPRCSCELSVNTIVPTYYEKGRNVPQDYLDPVWVFAGTFDDGTPGHYEVSAWQFANFTETPAPTPLSIQFNDTSDSGPTKWLWDFGDGTTSTDQNPVHSYASVGVYNTTLTAWNDLGSDTVTKEISVRDNPGPSVLNSPSDTTSGTQETRNISN